jgi:hypothetical protein
MKRAVLIAALACGTATGQPGFGPFGSPRAPVTRDARPERHAAPAATPDTFLYLSYEFYGRVLSPVDGVTCLHKPSCSRYALDAVRRYPVLGFLLAVDRLWRTTDSSAVRRLPLVRDGEYFFFFDPLEESDAWYRRSH